LSEWEKLGCAALHPIETTMMVAMPELDGATGCRRALAAAADGATGERSYASA